MASAYEDSKKYKEALKVLYRAQKINTEEETGAEIELKLASLEFLVGNLSNARQLYQEITTRNPTDHVSHGKL